MAIAHSQVVLPYFVLSYPIHQHQLHLRTQPIWLQSHGHCLQQMEALLPLIRSTSDNLTRLLTLKNKSSVMEHKLLLFQAGHVMLA